ncbi:hypothetical protein BC936DRAFT_143854 [Jimgerdemannia flammicorona]|uniref:Uncharacterized protein n=1 Tax=Jimgerdemannia flammicorona TaxID=994334 RepID=A0A433DDB6_9FUNG|nr:hypothetical protein BC936DRAFT_143854 [Jimgerdemannia flammicorona]
MNSVKSTRNGLYVVYPDEVLIASPKVLTVATKLRTIQTRNCFPNRHAIDRTGPIRRTRSLRSVPQQRVDMVPIR